MRILIAGGAGFLGSHLADFSLSKGHEVIVVDNFYTGSKKNIEHLIGGNNFEFLRHDITFPLFVEVDAIFNLACPASPIHYQRNPVQTLKTSVLGSINLLGLAKRLNIPILQASTSEIYGDPTISPQEESYWGNVNPIGLRSCYDEGKRAAETLFSDYHRQHGVDTRIARIFNTYGPRMGIGDGRVVSNFIVQALRGEDITIYGEGNQTRSFCFYSDLINGLYLLLLEVNNVHFPINLGNPEEISILNLAKLIIEETDSKSKIVYKPLPNDDPKQRKPDIDLALKKLNWEPKVELRDGIRHTISYFSELLKKNY